MSKFAKIFKNLSCCTFDKNSVHNPGDAASSDDGAQSIQPPKGLFDEDFDLFESIYPSKAPKPIQLPEQTKETTSGGAPRKDTPVPVRGLDLDFVYDSGYELASVRAEGADSTVSTPQVRASRSENVPEGLSLSDIEDLAWIATRARLESDEAYSDCRGTPIIKPFHALNVKSPMVDQVENIESDLSGDVAAPPTTPVIEKDVVRFASDDQIADHEIKHHSSLGAMSDMSSVDASFTPTDLLSASCSPSCVNRALDFDNGYEQNPLGIVEASALGQEYSF